MTERISCDSLKTLLRSDAEVALLDVREHGQYGAGHLFLATSLPYSRLEADIERMVPRRATRIVVYDDGEGVAEKAAEKLLSYGYGRVRVLDGGASAWARSGRSLFAGVHVPSKTFGELVAERLDVPFIAAQELQQLREDGGDVLVVDGRPPEEYRKMSIPGSVCVPNGELSYRIDGQVSGDVPVVVNCAGRTRSIIGAETLRRAGLANPVMALADGTMGWFLAGNQLEHDADRLYGAPIGRDEVVARRNRIADTHGIAFVAPDILAQWCADTAQTIYLLDVRTAEEFADSHIQGFRHAPGGQLVQATDLWLAVRGSRIVLVDDDDVRAVMAASWLTQMGWDASVLKGGVAVNRDLALALPRPEIADKLPDFPVIAPWDIDRDVHALIDLRPSIDFIAGHVAGAAWSIRPDLARDFGGEDRPIVVLADDPVIARAGAGELAALGRTVLGINTEPAAWPAHHEMVASPDSPPKERRTDFVFFTHGRHEGDREAALQYLAWEHGLIAQLHPDELAVFSLQSSDGRISEGT